MVELIAVSTAVLLLVLLCIFAVIYAVAALSKIFSEISAVRKEMDAEKEEMLKLEQHKRELYHKISESLRNSEGDKK